MAYAQGYYIRSAVGVTRLAPASNRLIRRFAARHGAPSRSEGIRRILERWEVAIPKFAIFVSRQDDGDTSEGTPLRAPEYGFHGRPIWGAPQ